MTPQLQQAIKLLQLSNIELAAFVEEQLESNPLLERGTGDENRRGEESDSQAASDYTEVSMEAPQAASSDIVDWSKASSSGGSFNGSSDYDPMDNTAAEISLSEHLNAQLAMAIKDPSALA